MCPAERVPVTSLLRRVDPAAIPFETTEAVQAEGLIIGQERAMEAVRFGIAMRGDGYNLFAVGPPGVGKQTLLRQFLDQQAASEPPPSDWLYVHDFEDAHRPRALRLPAGRAVALRTRMQRAVAELGSGMRVAFEADEHRTRKQRVIDAFKAEQEAAFAAIQERARQRRILVVRTETGIILGVLKGDTALEPAAFRALPDAERQLLEAAIDAVREELQVFERRLHEAGREHAAELLTLDRETASAVARRVLDEVRAAFADVPAVTGYLAAVELDVVDHAPDFLESEGKGGLEATLRRAFHTEQPDGPSFKRYQVNVLTDASDAHGAPVIYEPNPNHPNLLGRIEHVSQFGALLTDFTLIKAGALHRANGGYLLLDVLEVLRNPFAWQSLVRALRAREIRMESLGQLLGLVPTVSLEPEPIPLDVKVVLVGDRYIYYLLAQLDPHVPELFKVLVDFDEDTDRRPESLALYASFVARLVQQEALRPFARGAVARVLEHAGRLAGDADKLSVRIRPIVDLLREADLCARQAGREVVAAADVQAAIDAQLRRSGRVRERLLEAVRRDSILVDTSGARVGQVNGLSVLQIGGHAFGHPTRITARARVGKGEVIDIEREVELGGPLHSKGVLILSGFLGGRYGSSAPLALSASLVFEQSYGPVEGDSASLAETCALLSALAEVPIDQALAVTGSMNQHGQVQAIGAVNEKIEGFFDVCRERGLTGSQGVIIPRSNVHHLMLREDVVTAVAEGRFAIHAVATIDDAFALLTDCTDMDARVSERLASFAASVRRMRSDT